MRAYGYARDDDEQDQSVELREVSLNCTDADLARLRAFLTRVVADREQGTHIDENGWHRHLRDVDASWTSDECDVIFTFRP